MYIHYALYFTEKTEGQDNTTHSGRGTGQSSNGIQPSSETRLKVCTTKCSYFICSSSSYLLNMNDMKDFKYIILPTHY